jgi:hypothetical protein
MVEQQISNLFTRVRFPLPAPEIAPSAIMPLVINPFMFDVERTFDTVCKLCKGTVCVDYENSRLINMNNGRVPPNTSKIQMVSEKIYQCPIRMMMLGGTPEDTNPEQS